MAGRKQWLTRLPGLAEKLALLPDDLPIDRELLESLLGVPARTALRILAQLGAVKDAAGRCTLTKRALEAAVRRPEIAETLALRQKKERGKTDVLALKRRFRHAQSLRFPLVEARERWRLDELPAAVSLAPGRLTVEFADVPDLLWQLEVVVATLADDRAAAEDRLAGVPA